jgi:hypothetical protein
LQWLSVSQSRIHAPESIEYLAGNALDGRLIGNIAGKAHRDATMRESAPLRTRLSGEARVPKLEGIPTQRGDEVPLRRAPICFDGPWV